MREIHDHDRRYQLDTCFATQAKTQEPAKEIKPAQNHERPRAALTERK